MLPWYTDFDFDLLNIACRHSNTTSALDYDSMPQ